MAKATKIYDKYVINTECPIASQIGQNVIENGGNAVDATVASAIAIGIVNSFSAGIGGGGFVLLRDKPNNTYKFYDFRETVPEKANEEYFINNPMDLQNTIRSACVPGEVKGLHTLHSKHGKLPWKELFWENIKLCEEGFVASELLVKKLNKNAEDVLSDEGFKQIFTRNGKLIKEGDLVIRKNLGKTLKKIAEDPNSFYTGEVAQQISNFVKEQNGFISKADLSNYKCVERPILTTKFKEYNVVTTSLPTSGPFILLSLNILKNYDLDEFRKILRSTKNTYIYHFLIEIFKFMFYRRGEVEDPLFMDKPHVMIQDVISQELADEYFKFINFDKVLEKEHFKDMKEFKEDHGTTHLNVHKDGVSVLITTTVNLEFGSKVMDPTTGIIFNNHMDDFAVPNIESAYNLVGNGTFNRIEPNKRPFSSAAPTILETENETILIGAAGGTKIPTSIISTILFYYLDRDLYNAIAAPRLHEQLNGNVYVEPMFTKNLQIKLRELGHNIVECQEINSFTSVNAVVVANNKIYAVADPRKRGNSCGL